MVGRSSTPFAAVWACHPSLNEEFTVYTHEGYHVGDAWYFVDGDVIHMFYLTAKIKGENSSLTQANMDPFVGHAVSRDLVNWEMLPPALQTGPPGSWDDLQLCTGSIIKREGRYWMAYAATSTTENTLENPWRIQRGGMAVSNDLTTWQKVPENPVTVAGPPHYEQVSAGQREMAHWRDPFMFADGDFVYQFICARRPDGNVATRGTVAMTRSRDMVTWEILPPLEHDRVVEEMEVPQIHSINGRWYLVFCTLGRFFAPEFVRRFDGRLPERSTFAMVGDSPFGPFHIHGTGQIVEHGLDEYFTVGQLVHFAGQWHLLVTSHDDQGERISDPLPVEADDTGLHARRTDYPSVGA